MPTPPNCRAFLPVCLTLGALLCSLPAPADTPAAPAAAPTAQAILLQHTVPGDILKALHWDQGAQRFDGTAQVRVEGVTQISAQPTTNSLSVVATPAGFAKVQQLVKILDVAQRQVQIKFALTRAAAADLKASGIRFDVIPYPGLPSLPESNLGYASGIPAVVQFLQTLRMQGAVFQSPTVITTNNVDASLSLSGQPVPALPTVESFTFAATPRVNSDGTVTLALHPQAALRVAGKTNPDGTPATALQDLRTLRTVRSGDTLVIANLFPGAAGDRQLLLFVTPTILGYGNVTPSTPLKK